MAEPTAHTEAPSETRRVSRRFRSETFPCAARLADGDLHALLYVLMSKVALPRIGSILAARSKHIADDLAAAQRFKEQSDAAHAAYEKALADARSRAQGIANATREQQAAEAEATNKRLEAQLHERLVVAEQSIAATRTSAMGNVGTIAAETASAIVERLIGQGARRP